MFKFSVLSYKRSHINSTFFKHRTSMELPRTQSARGAAPAAAGGAPNSALVAVSI